MVKKHSSPSHAKKTSRSDSANRAPDNEPRIRYPTQSVISHASTKITAIAAILDLPLLTDNRLFNLFTVGFEGIFGIPNCSPANRSSILRQTTLTKMLHYSNL